MTREEIKKRLTNISGKIVDICKVHNLTLQQAMDLCRSIPDGFKCAILTEDMVEQPECPD